MFLPAGWSSAPVLRVTRVNTVSSVLWDITVLAQNSELSVPVSPATVMDTVTPVTLAQVTLTVYCLVTVNLLFTDWLFVQVHVTARTIRLV